MDELTQAELIWNRACEEGPSRTWPGDRALRDIIRAHGLVMNGGVFHAVECLTADQLSDAQDGYRFYGLDGAASLLSRARELVERDESLELYEHELDGQYAVVIPSDSSIVERFEAHLHANPSAYAALPISPPGDL